MRKLVIFVPSIEDGVRGMDFIEKTVESNSKGNIWVELNN